MKRFLSLMLCLCLLACAPLAHAQRYTASFLDVFDTASQIVIYSEDEGEANRIAQLVYNELRHSHQLFDQYNDYPGITGIHDLNRQAAKKPIKVETALFDLLVFSKEMYQVTGGKVNIAMGSVLQLWHQAREDGKANPESAYLPEIASLQAASQHTNLNDLILDAEEQTVFFADPALQLDLGAIAKGYAVECVARKLEENGISGVLLSIGGNVRIIGQRPDGTAFPVGVQNPDVASAQQHIAVLDLTDTSLVTSGSYQRFYTVGGKQYHHIIDPLTLMPADYLWAVSVVTRDSGRADALSTALFNLSLEDGMALVESLPDVEALWVLHDGTIVTSEGLKPLMRQP